MAGEQKERDLCQVSIMPDYPIIMQKQLWLDERKVHIYFQFLILKSFPDDWN